MKAILSSLAVVLLVLLLAPTAAARRVVVFAPELDETESKVLAEMLGAGDADGGQFAQDLKQALNEPSDLLVIMGGRKMLGDGIDASTLDKLRQTKVIGIGFGPAQLFEEMGLEICSGACAHNPLTKAPKIDMTANKTFPAYSGKTIVAYRLPEDLQADEHETLDYNFAMFLPKRDDLTQFVEAFARWHGDVNYAPIVRQGNYVLIGLAAPPSTWTNEYKQFLAELTDTIASAPAQPFTRAEFETTKPGTYDVDLARGNSTGELARQTFRFQFQRPLKFSAKLTAEDSNAVMLLFHGPNMELYDRQDTDGGQSLSIRADIDRRILRTAGDGYWELDVSNFDRSARAKCKLEIEY